MQLPDVGILDGEACCLLVAAVAFQVMLVGLVVGAQG